MSEYPADKIFAEDAAVKAIADTENAPFYLYDEKGIEARIHTLHQMFSWSCGYQNYFPIRLNLNPVLLSLLHDHGTGVCANSRAELQLALKCGFGGDHILYEPSRTDAVAEKLALEAGAAWLCNSSDLIPERIPSKLILRYNPCDLPFPKVQKQPISRSKNGFNREQLFSTVSDLQSKGLTEIGLALQISTYSIHCGFWAKKASILVRLMDELQSRTGIAVSCLHIGEGPGLPYDPKINVPDIFDEVRQVRTVLEASKSGVQPAILTGVSSRLMEECGILIAKVLEVRYILKTYLILDAGICQYCRPALKQAYRHVSVLGNHQIENRKLYSIVGDMPDSIDRLVNKGRMLPQVVPGDYCIIHDTGCGARSMPMLYGLRPVAAEYLYQADGTIRKISSSRTSEEVLEFLTAL